MRAAKHSKGIASDLISILFMPLSILYLEIVYRIYYLACHTISVGDYLGRFFGAGLWLTVFFSLSVGLFINLLCTFFKPKVNFWVSVGILGVLSVLFMAHAIYHSSFNNVLRLTLAADTGGDAITDFFWTVTVPSTIKMLWMVVIMALPIALLLIFGRHRKPPKKPHGARWHELFDKPLIKFEQYPMVGKTVLLLVVVILHVLPWGVVMMTDKTTGLRAQYTTAFEHSVAAEKFGIMTMTRREIMISLSKKFGIGSEPELLPEDSSSGSEEEIEPTVTYNVMDIDFDSLIANETDTSILKAHKYFAQREPTRQNEFTGIFEGYNLIMMTAEGFSPYCISEELTPTLYKMQQQGFRFTNFYTAGYDDTTTGEFVHTTGLIPSNSVANNLKTVKDNWLPFTMGRQFQKAGVRTHAYHPHSYKYYGRDETHPNLGYDVYRGNGGGIVDGSFSASNALELEHSKWWPESDLEAVISSGPEYIGNGRFHAYYMTVSGHKDYSFSDNMMSYKNRDLVKDLPYSETIRAYFAANIELDRACEELIRQLEATGQLENTVFCITPDHKPQQLSADEVNEMAGKELDHEFEVYRSVFLLYCPGFDGAIEVSAPANSIDIIPTLSNLFGFEYDSRLLFGRDLLDESADQLITFRTRSWISDKGRYNFKQKEFIPNEGVTFASEEEQMEYVKRINNIVSNKFAVSETVILEDYYGKIFKK